MSRENQYCFREGYKIVNSSKFLTFSQNLLISILYLIS